MMFNINFLIHIVFIIIMTIGFNSYGACGILVMSILYVHNHSLYGLLAVIATLLWFINLVASLILYKKSFEVNSKIQFTKIVREKLQTGDLLK